MERVTNIESIKKIIEQFGDMVIGKNERNNVIVMSMEEYRKKMLDEEIERQLLKSEEDYEQGRTRDAEEVFREWKEKYGI